MPSSASKIPTIEHRVTNIIQKVTGWPILPLSVSSKKNTGPITIPTTDWKSRPICFLSILFYPFLLKMGKNELKIMAPPSTAPAWVYIPWYAITPEETSMSAIPTLSIHTAILSLFDIFVPFCLRLLLHLVQYNTYELLAIPSKTVFCFSTDG